MLVFNVSPSYRFPTSAPYPLPLDHSAVMSSWLRFERSSERNITSLLHSRLSSDSAANWREMNLDFKTIKSWLSSFPSDRFSQVLILRLATNSISKARGNLVLCPWCAVEASTSHILVDCPQLQSGRAEAYAFSCTTTSPHILPNLNICSFRNNPGLLSAFLKANRAKLSALFQHSSKKPPRAPS